MALKAGYMGLCVIGGIKLRVSDFSVNVKQEVEFYDYIIGLRDSLPGIAIAPGGVIYHTSKGDTGQQNVQQYFWRPGVKLVSGSFSFPATLLALKTFYNLTRSGDDFQMTFYYECDGIKREYLDCKVNSFTFTATAGNVLQLQVDIMARGMTEGNLLASVKNREAEKLITWDAINVISSSVNPIQQFSFSVSNNCMPIYTAGNNLTDGLFPKKIRVGMQKMQGSLIHYIKGVNYSGLDKDTSYDTIRIDIEDPCGISFVEELCVIYTPIQRTGTPGVLFHTLPFVGVGKPMGTP